MAKQLDHGRNVLVNYQSDSGENVKVISGTRKQNVIREVYDRRRGITDEKYKTIKIFFVDVYVDNDKVEEYSAEDIFPKDLPVLKSQLEELASLEVSADELVLNIHEFIDSNKYGGILEQNQTGDFY